MLIKNCRRPGLGPNPIVVLVWRYGTYAKVLHPGRYVRGGVRMGRRWLGRCSDLGSLFRNNLLEIHWRIAIEVDSRPRDALRAIP